MMKKNNEVSKLLSKDELDKVLGGSECYDIMLLANCRSSADCNWSSRLHNYLDDLGLEQEMKAHTAATGHKKFGIIPVPK